MYALIMLYFKVLQPHGRINSLPWCSTTALMCAARMEVVRRGNLVEIMDFMTRMERNMLLEVPR